MPNHVTNELTAARHIIDAIASPESHVDFETIVPMPEVLRGEPNSAVINWAEIATGTIKLSELNKPPSVNVVDAFRSGNYGAAADVLKRSNITRMLLDGPFPKDFEKDDFEALLKCMRAIYETGFPSWYDWSVQNWGTKWNAYRAKRIDERTVRFETAWSVPAKWFVALSEKFLGEALTIRWADEDFGNNAGRIVINCDGTLEGGPFENGSDEAKRLAVELGIYHEEEEAQ